MCWYVSVSSLLYPPLCFVLVSRSGMCYDIYLRHTMEDQGTKALCQVAPGSNHKVAPGCDHYPQLAVRGCLWKNVTQVRDHKSSIPTKVYYGSRVVSSATYPSVSPVTGLTLNTEALRTS